MSVNSYAPAPFWFLNHRLEKEELQRQLQLMKDSGVSGFFIHPRAGLDTPYGSKEWFDCVQFIVEESEKLGLQAWLYDEDPFPSGAAGGRLLLENPSFCARNLCHRIVKADENGRYREDLGEVCVLLAVSYRRNADGRAVELREVTDCIGMVRRNYHKSNWNSSYFCDWRPDVPYPHYRAETFFPQMCLQLTEEAGREVCVVYTEESVNDGKYGKAPDCLNAECTTRFLELTHEKYAKLLGENFGNVIPGIFTDEPVPGGSLPWTGNLEQVFREECGYELRGQLWKLWLPAEDAENLRADYWKTVSGLYQKNFLQPISEWCRENGLLFTGHMPGEENPMTHSYCGGSAYSAMKYLDVPGFDILGNNLGNIERPSLIFGGKSISSAARQQGKKRVLCEAFACNGFDFGPADMKRVTDWLFALGINWIVPHGFYYSYDGYRKYDAGKSFFFQDEAFKDFPYYARYAGETGAFLADCEADGDTALVYPAEKLTRYLPAEPEKAEIVQKACFHAVSELCRQQIPFDIVEEETLRTAKYENGSIICGQRVYRQLVIASMEDENEAWYETVKQYGVKTYCAMKEQEMCQLKQQEGSYCFVGTHTEHLLVNHLKKEGKKYLFVFNNSDSEVTFAFENEQEAYTLDCVAGGMVSCDRQWILQGFQSVFLCMTNISETLTEASVYPGSFTTLHYQNPEWMYLPKGAEKSISKWDVLISHGTETERWENREACPVRELYGTELPEIQNRRKRPIFDQAPVVPSLYPVEAVYLYEFEWKKTDENVLLVIEGSTLQGKWILRINGEQITADAFRLKRIYDLTNRVANVTRYIRNGKNIIQVQFESAGEDDGLYSSMYLYRGKEMTV